ncbi:MAG: hypothetical protein KJZ53_09465 [Anaerolineales bacterium]|nr:hypothetical protein [Anaerolineales bacterium]
MVKIGAVLSLLGGLVGAVAMAALGFSVLSFGPPAVPGLLLILLHVAGFIYILSTCYKVLRGAKPTWWLLVASVALVASGLVPASTIGSVALWPGLVCLFGVALVLVGADDLP